MVEKKIDLPDRIYILGFYATSEYPEQFFHALHTQDYVEAVKIAKCFFGNSAPYHLFYRQRKKDVDKPE